MSKLTLLLACATFAVLSTSIDAQYGRRGGAGIGRGVGFNRRGAGFGSNINRGWGTEIGHIGLNRRGISGAWNDPWRYSYARFPSHRVGYSWRRFSNDEDDLDVQAYDDDIVNDGVDNGFNANNRIYNENQQKNNDNQDNTEFASTTIVNTLQWKGVRDQSQQQQKFAKGPSKGFSKHGFAKDYTQPNQQNLQQNQPLARDQHDGQQEHIPKY